MSTVGHTAEVVRAAVVTYARATPQVLNPMPSPARERQAETPTEEGLAMGHAPTTPVVPSTPATNSPASVMMSPTMSLTSPVTSGPPAIVVPMISPAGVTPPSRQPSQRAQPGKIRVPAAFLQAQGLTSPVSPLTPRTKPKSPIFPSPDQATHSPATESVAKGTVETERLPPPRERTPSPAESHESSESGSAGWSEASSTHRPALTVGTAVSSVDGEGSPRTPGITYLDTSSSASPSPAQASFGEPSVAPTHKTLSVVIQDEDTSEDDEPCGDDEHLGGEQTIEVALNAFPEPPASAGFDNRMSRPRIVVNGLEPTSPQHTLPPSASSSASTVSPSPSPSPSTASPATASASPATPRYRGWVTEIVRPLAAWIDDSVDPTVQYVDLQEIGEGESGSVYAARYVPSAGARQGKSREDTSPSAGMELVAIKSVPLVPTGSPKLVDLRRELELMREVRHAHVLTMDRLFVDHLEDALWIRMELMETSLADVLGLVDEGVEVNEGMMARFAADVSGSQLRVLLRTDEIWCRHSQRWRTFRR
jgi:hypothetical protein